LQLPREGFDQLRHIAGDADGLGDVAEGVLGDGLVAGLAEDEADGGFVVGVAEQVIDRRQVLCRAADYAGQSGDEPFLSLTLRIGLSSPGAKDSA
jgi:hypothetical protein